MMSNIEKKYRQKISEVFDDLVRVDDDILKLLKHKSLSKAEGIAKLYASLNMHVNLILRKFYPEIKEMEDKLEIKSHLKFYYDLLDKLTNFLRNIEDFQKIDDEYYEKIMEFIEDKDILIRGKYRDICTDELYAFYNPASRTQLEEILAKKFENQNRQFFTMGPLEEEIKKIAMIEGAEDVKITLSTEEQDELLKGAKSVITYTLKNDVEDSKIGNVLKGFLESKKYGVLAKPGVLITDASLLPDK